MKSGRGGGGGFGGGGQDGCERRIEVFENIQKKYFFIWGGDRGSGWGVRVDVNREVKFLSSPVGGGGSGEGSGWM